jgi:flagellum-specific peptidoglycan hydrolase FlgJ
MKRLTIVVLLSITFSFSYSQTLCEVYEEIRAYGIKHADIVLKQSILETGWFKSKLCKEYNNLFGFFYNGSFLKFDFWEQSISYYKCWQDKHLNAGCNNYYEFLEVIGYAEDKEYINKLKSIKYDLG